MASLSSPGPYVHPQNRSLQVMFSRSQTDHSHAATGVKIVAVLWRMDSPLRHETDLIRMIGAESLSKQLNLFQAAVNKGE